MQTNAKKNFFAKFKRHLAPKDHRRGIVEKLTMALAFIVFMLYAALMIYMIL